MMARILEGRWIGFPFEFFDFCDLRVELSSAALVRTQRHFTSVDKASDLVWKNLSASVDHDIISEEVFVAVLNCCRKILSP